MRLNFYISLFAVLLLCPMLGRAFDTAGYQPASFAAWEDTVRESDGFPERSKNFLFDADFPKLATTVEYTGHRRGIAEATQQFIASFARSVIEKPELAAQFDDEVEVREKGKNHWVCVHKADWQKQTAGIKAGARIILYQRFVGVAKGLQFVYLLSDVKR